MRTLKELTDAQEELSKEVSNYYKNTIAPKIKNCKTRAELNALRNELSVEAADKHGQVRDFPFPIDIELICAASAFND